MNNIPTQDLHHAAEEFRQAGQDTLEIAKRLENITSLLEKNWEGAVKQVFFQQYKEWSQLSGGFAALLNNIAVELQSMAERYEDADSKF